MSVKSAAYFTCITSAALFTRVFTRACVNKALAVLFLVLPGMELASLRANARRRAVPSVATAHQGKAVKNVLFSPIWPA